MGQFLYKEILKIKGHEVIGDAPNGTDLLEKLNNLKVEPDFILLDNRISITNGIDTIRDLLKKNPSLKIIFISSDETMKEEALAAGAISFIKKPFNLKNFYNSIHQLTT
jgi:response regulator of citrate/malate metabolism